MLLRLALRPAPGCWLLLGWLLLRVGLASR
jgi:hypothetical protein